MINSSVFKAYDIRGLSPGEIDVDFAFRLGQVFVKKTGAKKVAVGKDMRATTPELAEALIKGLISQGAEVIDIGLVTTPMFYFAVAEYGYEAGIMVTASHNPAKYNGFKMVRTGAVPIGSEEIQEIRQLMETVNTEVSLPYMLFNGSDTSVFDIKDAYLKKVLSLVDISGLDKLKVVIDAGNGMNGLILPALTAAIGVKVKPLYWELDGNFPNHEANPIKEETLADLKAAVIAKKADLGIAYDGDGDRIGFIDEQGQFISNDLIAGLLVAEISKKYPSAAILYDIRSSNIVAEEIERAKGRPVISPIGHTHIKKLMRKESAVFASELSGHFYFKDFYGVECTDLAMLLVLKKIAESGKKISELIVPFRRYFHSGEINFEVVDKVGVIDRLEKTYGAGRVNKLDGLRVDFDEWWFLVRPSNTEPLLRLVLEAKSLELMRSKRDELSQLVTGNR